MLDKSKGALLRIKAFLDFFKVVQENENYSGGCPFGNLSLEMAISMKVSQKEYHRVLKK
jgi:hypothetical protein